MQNVLVKKVAAAAIAGAIALTSTAAFAAPVSFANATIEKSAPGEITHVYWRRWGWGPGPWVGAGIAAGVLAGAAIANANRPYYYYDPYYAPPAYAEPGSYYYYDAPPQQPAPVPPSPAYPRRCWVEAGVNGQTGYWTPC
ncbi:MAG TPA: hypothetical protein VKT73_06705 [Xanthobacteraceae bacterium]|nr:hypothetical protein [Xanthobacteraceae bacterium]